MKYTFFIFTLLVSYSIFGQINVGPIEHVKRNTGEFEQADLEKLQSTKTLFVYRESDNDDLNLFKTTLQEAWDYTELEFISYDEYLANTYDDTYSFFTIGGLHKVKTSSSGTVTELTYIYLSLWMNDGDEELYFSRMDLYPTFPTYEKANEYISRDNEKFMRYLYEESTLHNWNISYLKNTLQFINKKLVNAEEHWVFNSETYSSLSDLKKDTLYIPEYTKIKFAMFSGDESQRHKVKKLMKKYPYPYKVLPMSEITEKITNSTKPVYYLSYIKSCTDKYISIFEGLSGELLYSDYSPMSYNIKHKDLGKLADAIK